MAEINPEYIDGLSYVAKMDRQPFRDVLTEGILTSGALAVTQSGTSAMSVLVSGSASDDVAYVQNDEGTDRGHYRIKNDAPVTKTIAASDPSNPRIDRIIAQIYDATDISGALNKWALEVLTGTPAASPSPPALPNNALDLALVAVAANAATIVNANITSQRVRVSSNLFLDLVNPQTKAGVLTLSSDPVFSTGGVVTQINTATLTNKTLTSPLFTGTIDGWIATDTFTYASANTITVASGAALIYQKGDKIKWTQTTVKYGVIITVADTLLTIATNTNYIVTNAVITLPYYSHIENPLGFPDWFNWSTTTGVLAPMTFSSIVATHSLFSIKGKTVYFKIGIGGTTGGTASNYLSFTLPVASAISTENQGILGTTLIIDTGTYSGGGIVTNLNDTTIKVLKQDLSNYGLGANTGFIVTGFYEMA